MCIRIFINIPTQEERVVVQTTGGGGGGGVEEGVSAEASIGAHAHSRNNSAMLPN